MFTPFRHARCGNALELVPRVVCAAPVDQHWPKDANPGASLRCPTCRTLVALDELLTQPAMTGEAIDQFDYAALDPGIRSIVRILHAAGFETTDSGDGVSKPADWYESGCAIPFPHVVAVTTTATMIEDADRMAWVLGPGWTVEAEYQTLSKQAHLFARALDPREVDRRWPEETTR